MSSTNGKLGKRAEEEEKVTELVVEFLQNHNPKEMDNIAFRGARYDAGLAWVHFPE